MTIRLSLKDQHGKTRVGPSEAKQEGPERQLPGCAGHVNTPRADADFPGLAAARAPIWASTLESVALIPMRFGYGTNHTYMSAWLQDVVADWKLVRHPSRL